MPPREGSTAVKDIPPFRVPAPVRHVLSLLPGRPGAWLFAASLNTVLAPHLDADARRALEGRRLRLAVTDAGIVFDASWRGRAFISAHGAGAPDLVVAATLYDLSRLATRKEDPDTLFFSRRLVMEGDTELGLLIKNTLDAIDGALFDPQRLVPSALFDRLRPRRRTC
jgi:O2-independent ubiquinone biosynthesis accessory factor UbiT